MKNQVRRLVFIALFCALVAVGTIVFSIPLPATQGYINFGDTVIFVAAGFLGPIGAMLAGAIGSSLADLFLGFAHWAPFTFFIKGLEGLVCGAILTRHQSNRHDNKGFALQLFAFVAAGFVMLSGYYLAAGILFGFGAALASLVGNVIQAGVSIIVALIVSRMLMRINVPFGD